MARASWLGYFFAFEKLRLPKRALEYAAHLRVAVGKLETISLERDKRGRKKASADEVTKRAPPPPPVTSAPHVLVRMEKDRGGNRFAHNKFGKMVRTPAGRASLQATECAGSRAARLNADRTPFHTSHTLVDRGRLALCSTGGAHTLQRARGLLKARCMGSSLFDFRPGPRSGGASASNVIWQASTLEVEGQVLPPKPCLNQASAMRGRAAAA